MRAADFPLFLAYAAFPLAAHAERLLGASVPRNWIDAVWLAAGFAALLTLLHRRRLPASMSAVSLVAALGCLAALLALVRFGPQALGGISLYPWLMELKPLFYAALSLLWFAAFGVPSPRAFRAYGLVLAVFVLAEFAAVSILAGQALRPEGSGEINYDACLILISLTLGLYSGRMPRPALMFLFAGLAATFSRTALGAAAVVFILAPNRGPVFKAAFASAAIGFMLLSFSVRGLPMDAAEQFDRLCMWKAGVELIAGNPGQALTGFAPGLPLPVRVPAGLEALWSQQKKAWDLPGVFAYNFHSFWLRTAVTWGLAAPAALLAILLYSILRPPSRPVRGLAALTLVMGLTMGLIYLSNVAVPLCLGFIAAARGPEAPEAGP